MVKMNFEFATATRIIFGAGSIRKIGALGLEMGRQALVVTGIGSKLADPLVKILSASGINFKIFEVDREPTVELVNQGVKLARREMCDLVIGLGGGSAIDTGKAIAVLLTNAGEIYDYLEVIGRGKALTKPSLPFIAIPTTAGTGAEVTRNAVLGAPNQRVKVSLRSPFMLPRLALVDPQLTYNLPPEVTASTGLDAITQLIEPYVTNQANPLTDTLCREGLKRAGHSLLRAYQYGEDASAREDMALASLFSGLALANAKLGAVHGFAATLGGMLNAPHGAICARLLPFVMQTNIRALQDRDPGNPSLKRYDEIAEILTGLSGARAVEGVDWVDALCTTLQVSSLSKYGLSAQDFPYLIKDSAKASSMQGNPIKLTEEEMRDILSRAL
jgi:alcohol dehydrogenase class IV